MKEIKDLGYYEVKEAEVTIPKIVMANCPVCNNEVVIPWGDANICNNCELTVVDFQGNWYGHVNSPYFSCIWIPEALIKAVTPYVGKINSDLLEALKEKWNRSRK